MDRAWLEEQLASGRSIESIARDMDRDPSTVSYWARKYGLRSAHAARHAARGGIERELLAELVDAGLSTRDIAARVDRSQATVRHWLREYGHAHGAETSPSHRRRARNRARVRGAWHDDVRAIWPGRPLSLPALPPTASVQPPQAREGDPRRGGGRSLPTVRL
jgi:transposase-like protein